MKSDGLSPPVDDARIVRAVSSPAHPVAPAPAHSLLPYADVPSQYGVIVEHRHDGLTITVPKRQVPLWLAIVVAFGFFACCVCPMLFGTFAQAVASVAVVVGLLAVAGFAWAMRRLLLDRRKALDWAVAFDVRGEQLTIRWRGTDGEDLSAECRRDEITSIRGDLYRMGLTIRIRRRAIVELLHDRPKVLRVWIARTLCEALRLPVETSRREGR